jgi:catechol 2,3-dioxygenase-like lactoylglutathione lyase family enzyme
MTTNTWPGHLRVGALRVVRSSVHYDETIEFYRDLVGLPVIAEFRGSYGEDGTIFGLPDAVTHLEIVRSHHAAPPPEEFDQLVFYFPDQDAVEDATEKLRANGVRPERDQHPYWEENGGTTFRDPDGRGVIFASWVFGRDPQPSDGGHGDPRLPDDVSDSRQTDS